MVVHELLEIADTLLQDRNEEVREQSALLIGALAISRLARERFACAFPNLRELLEDKVPAVRVAVSLTFERLSINQHGCELIVKSQSADSLIESFQKRGYYEEKELVAESEYMIHLLETFINLTFSDEGIEPFLGTKAVQTMTHLIQKDDSDSPEMA